MSPARANAEALGTLALMALAAAFMAMAAILFVPLAIALTALGAGAVGGHVAQLAAALFLATWNCALAPETFAAPTPGRVAWMGLRTIPLVGGAAFVLGGA